MSKSILKEVSKEKLAQGHAANILYEAKSRISFIDKFFDHAMSDQDGIEMNPDQVYGFSLTISDIYKIVEEAEQTLIGNDEAQER